VELDLSAVDPLWIAIAAGVLLLLLLVLIVALVRRRRRRKQLQERYGAEYHRSVQEAGSRRAADRELREREERRRGYELQALSRADRDGFEARWEALQAAFVDGPETAVRQADDLLDQVATRRGYPSADRDRRLGDLSVDHPEAVDSYRSGRPRGDDDRSPTTEQWRHALLSSRQLFEALLGPAPDPADVPPPPFEDTRDAGDPEPGLREPAHRERAVDPPADRDRAIPETELRRSAPTTAGDVHGSAPTEPPPAAHVNGDGEHADGTDRRNGRTEGDQTPVLGPDGRPLSHDRR
jgi:hypothetical protein